MHAAAGVLIIAGTTTAGFRAIADGVDPATLTTDYHPAVGAILNQHAWNLLWGGLVTIIGAGFIWRENMTAIWVTAMVGGRLDIGYFACLDLGGFVMFFPGTLMTIVSASAVILSAPVWFARRNVRSAQFFPDCLKRFGREVGKDKHGKAANPPTQLMILREPVPINAHKKRCTPACG
ncbi:MAG: hypothetical protein AAFV69_15740 [Pseudomonadota bacterium]